MAQKTVTAVGNAQIDTAQKKFGTGSLYSPAHAGSDAITIPASADFSFPTGTDFTIEFFFRLNDVTVDGPVLYDINGSSGKGLMIAFRKGTNPSIVQKFEIYDYTNDDHLSLAAWNTLANDTWYHFALVRSGTTITGYIDGSSIGTVTNADKGNSANTLYIGGYHTPNFGLAGYTDEIRVLKGKAAYTSNFTPPTAPFGYDATCVLLLHCDSTLDGDTLFYDSSVDTDILDYEQTVRSNNFTGIGQETGRIQACNWTTGAGVTNVTRIKIWVAKVGTPNPLVLSVYGVDGSDAPTGSALGSKELAAANVNSGAETVFVFASPITISAATTYAYVLEGNPRTKDTDNQYLSYGINGSGSTWLDDSPYSGWQGPYTQGLYTKTYYTVPTTNIKTINGLAQASVKTINGLAIASVKSWNGLE